MRCPFEWVVGDSSKGHTVTAPTFSAGPRPPAATPLYGALLVGRCVCFLLLRAGVLAVVCRALLHILAGGALVVAAECRGWEVEAGAVGG